MQRAAITVVLKNGERYDANHISISRDARYRPHDSGAGLQLDGAGSVVSFVCSGSLTTKPAEDVDRIEYWPTGAQHCGECDGSIWNFVGAGPFANPEPLAP